MFARLIKIFSTILVSFALSAPPLALAGDDGIVKVKSAYPLAATIERLKSDIAGKGIKFFDEIDQSKLAADAGIKLRPSVLLVFGNRWARSSSRRTPRPGSIGRCGSWYSRTNPAKCGWPTRTLAGSPAAMASRAATISSIWPPR